MHAGKSHAQQLHNQQQQQTAAPGGEMMLANKQYRPQLPDEHFPMHAGKSHAQQLHNQQIKLPLYPLPQSYVPPTHQSHIMVQKIQQYNWQN